MGNACTSIRKTAIDVIPDREAMIQVVDQIVALEELLKAGAKADEREVQKVRRAVDAIKKLQGAAERV
jgi:hypothetical protein